MADINVSFQHDNENINIKSVRRYYLNYSVTLSNNETGMHHHTESVTRFTDRNAFISWREVSMG